MRVVSQTGGAKLRSPSVLITFSIMTINFSGRHFPSDFLLLVVRYYLVYKLSYREIEEIMAERGIHVVHSTINRWVIKYAPVTGASRSTNEKASCVIVADGRDIH